MTVSQRKITTALEIANEAHRNEWRKGSGLPYMTHIYDVMKLASKIGVHISDWETYCTIILHDTIESGLDVGSIKFKVDNTVGDYVELLSYIPEKGISDQLNKARKQAYLDGLADPSTPLPVLLVKALDRLCNVVDFYNSDDYDYAKKYLWKADALFYAAIITRDDALSQYYGWEVAKNLISEHNRVAELVLVDPHF